MIVSDIHTHTIHSDGKSTPREMVESAIKLGLEVYGTADHQKTPFDLSYCSKDIEKYHDEVNALKQKYKDKIILLCGIEEDGTTPVENPEDFDFVINSLHYIKCGDTYYSADGTVEELLDCRKNHFADNGVEMACAYFQQLGEYLLSKNTKIIAHFDLITKLNKNNVLFDADDKKYLDTALSLADELIKRDVIFEMNTGAISRGYTNLPYPDDRILKFLAKKNAKIMFSSDAHHRDNLCYRFDLCKELAKKAGFETVWQYGENGFFESKI